MPEQPRSRRQTRAAILTHLLQSGGSFRPPLAKAVRLSEASLSRILFDLKAEGLIEEVRRPAPYVGGPTGLVSLDGSVALAAVELTAQWLSVGVGGLSGELRDALGRLSRAERELIALRVVLGMDAAEAGRVTGMSPSAVGTGLHRALTKLRQEVARP